MEILDCHRKENNWFDSGESIEFGSNQLQINSPDDYNFENTEEDWLNWKFTHVLNQFNGIGSGDFVFNADYIYRKPDSFSKYKDSSILLFAGGPSTNKLLDDELPKVDYFWSLNYFYKNDRLPKIDLAALGKEVDMGDKKLIDYIGKNSTDILFEEDKDDMSPELHLQSLFPSLVSFYKLRYSSKLGIGVRMFIYAILLGVKEINFVGLDGLMPDGDTENSHSFQGSKNYGGNWGLTYNQKSKLTKRQFIEIWEYIMKLKSERNFQINNLSEKYDDVSLFGKITKQWGE